MKIFKSFTLIKQAVSLSIVMALAIGVYEFFNYKNETENLEKNIISILLTNEDQIEKLINTPVFSTQFLAHNHEAINFLRDPTKNAQSQINIYQDLKHLTKNRPHFLQIRLLDSLGHEVFRLNNDSVQTMTPSDKLQYKGKRPYFTQSINLKANHYFISPITLNVERGVIEKPYQPTLRIAAPIDDYNGERLGVIVINYDPTLIFEQLSDISSNQISLAPLFFSSTGHFISHKDTSSLYGNFIKEREKFNLSNNYNLNNEACTQNINCENKSYALTSLVLEHEGLTLFNFGLIHTKSDFFNNYLKQGISRFLFYSLILGFIIFLLKILQDSQRRKVAEREKEKKHNAFIQRTFDRMPFGVSIINLEGKLLFKNQYLSKISPENNIDRFCWEVYKDDQKKCKKCPIFNEKHFGIEDINKGSFLQGSLLNGKTYKLHHEKIEYQGGEAILEVLIDLTQQVKIEERLKKAQKKAEKSDLDKSTFLSVLSSQLKIPIFNINDTLNLLMDTALNKAQKDQFKFIQNNGNQLVNTFNNVIDFSKINLGSLYLEHEVFELKNLCQDIFDSYKYLAKEKHLNFTFSYPSDAPELIRGDARHLHQVLSNIIDNALKFTNKGDVNFSVVIPKNTHGEMIEFHIKDTGPGIKAELQENLLKGFYSGKTNANLGLAIAQSIVELMGSNIEFESSVGVGSSFHFKLDTHTLTQEETSQYFENQKGNSTDQPEFNLLIVDDDLSNQTILNLLLKKIGFLNIDIASSGSEAIASAKEKQYHLIFMDYHMPNMNGMEAAEVIIKNGYKNEIITITADTRKEIKEECLKYGITRHLKKPFNPNEIKELFKEDLS